jgi:two-component system chemotaxis sensor kinase CheA
MIGELMIAESMVVQSKEIRAVRSQELLKNIGLMDKITRTLHEAGLMLRMVPIKETFQKMVRLVRDTAKKSGKTIQCNIQGEDTELDKTLVDKIGEPLLHIIRNAVDHGIEDSEQSRITSGKPPHGTIDIRAFHKSGFVHIEIEDDGQGLNKASIIQKAKENNLISDESQISDDDVFKLIFEPGFSTAEQITDLSGRGQGMGVVKDVVDSLHGQINCRSIEGKGCMFTLKIPLTLAIIDGMIVRAGKDRFIIPTLSIITSCRLETKSVTELISREKTILVQGRLIPLIDLCSWFEIEKDTSGKGPELMVVVENGARRIALAVDEIIGKQQIVIKNLGAGFKHSAGISGAAIMPDGTVGLIVDIDRLTHL